MNILVEKLPTEIEVDGQLCKINSDFRPCLRTILAFEDPDLAMYEKQLVMFENLYSTIPRNVSAGLIKAVWFLNGGQDNPKEDDGPRLVSFEKDSGLIFSAFRQTHGIDLEAVEYMHWWKFMALFMDLGKDTVFCDLVGLRKRVKTGKATKEEKAAAREMGDMFIIPEIDDRTLEEKEAERLFMDLVHKAEDKHGSC